MVDLDTPDDVRFPGWNGASGYMVYASTFVHFARH